MWFDTCHCGTGVRLEHHMSSMKSQSQTFTFEMHLFGGNNMTVRAEKHRKSVPHWPAPGCQAYHMGRHVTSFGLNETPLFQKTTPPPPRKLTCPLWTIFLKENPSSKPLIFRRSFSGSCKAVFNCPIQGKRPCSALWNITKTGSFSPLKGDLKPSNKGHTSKTLLSPQFSRNLRVTPRCYATPPKQIRPYSGTINPHCLI